MHSAANATVTLTATATATVTVTVVGHLRCAPAIGVLGHHANDQQAAPLRQRACAGREHVAAHALPYQVDPLQWTVRRSSYST